MSEEELYHHGILGMHWGIRRYQDANGSYTSAGKRRYISDNTKKNTADINSYKSMKNGLSTASGKQIFTKDDVAKMVADSKAAKAKKEAKLSKEWDTEKAKSDFKAANKDKNSFLMKTSLKDRVGFGKEGAKRVNKTQDTYNKLSLKALKAEAKYKSIKAPTDDKARKAEFNTYRNAMLKNGLPGSIMDAGNRKYSTSVYNSLSARKGKDYADSVVKSASSINTVMLIGYSALSVGSFALSAYSANHM